MKKVGLLLFGIVISMGILEAQNDTMYVMKSGLVIGKYSTSEIDSIIFYKPLELGKSLTDIDGNVYNSVNIGTQTWMAENLKTTHYADGTPIPKVVGNDNWNALTATSQAYCWYDDDSITYAGTFGAYYTWAAAMYGAGSSTEIPSEIQGVCPDGWHLPSDGEWTIMEKYLIANGFNYDGTGTSNKIGKSLAATSHWFSATEEGSVGNNDYPTYRNRTRFSALPGGYRDSFGSFNYIHNEGHWWSASEFSSGSSFFRSMAYYGDGLFTWSPLCYYKELGFTVRCIAD